MSDRIVDENGVGAKQRKMNGMAAKIGGDGIRLDDGTIISGPMEDMRASWTREIRAIAPGVPIDHRSFRRRGLAIEPVTYVPRGQIREQEARGDDRWKRHRKRELAKRKSSTDRETRKSPGEGAVVPPPTWRFPDLANKPRKSRSLGKKDLEMATLAYAAHRNIELRHLMQTTSTIVHERQPPYGDFVTIAVPTDATIS